MLGIVWVPVYALHAINARKVKDCCHIVPVRVRKVAKKDERGLNRLKIDELNKRIENKRRNNMKLMKEYSYKQIDEFGESNNYNIVTVGRNVIGEEFITLSHDEKDTSISFVLVGVNGAGYVYRCIYSDLEE